MTNLARRILLACGALSLTACSILQPQPDPSRFFVLTPMAHSSLPPPAKALRLGLGPIDFPPYLKRAQIVTRVGTNEIELSEIHRWGEPLDLNFTRVLAQNLTSLLATEQILFFPWYGGAQLNYAIQVGVTQFQVDTRGEARLLARWKIVDPVNDKVRRSEESDLTETAADSSPDAAVAALSRLVEKLSREIAAAIEELKG